MSTQTPRFSLRAPEPADSPERKEAYATIEAAFKAGKMEQAHRLLFSLLETEGKTPEFWLLLTWTAPDRRAAETFFSHLVRRHPNFPAVKEGVQWSGVEWGAASQAGAVESGEAEKAQPATPVEDWPPVREKAGKIEPIGAGRDSEPGDAPAQRPAPADGKPTAGRVKEWWTPVGDRSAGGIEKVRWEPVNPGLNVPVSSREARWWAGAAPGAGSAAAEAEESAVEVPAEESTPVSAKPHLPSRSRVGLKWLVEDLSQLQFAIALGLYLPIIALAEAVAAFINPYLGVAIHAVLLVLTLVYGLHKAVKGEKKFLLSLGLVPLIRLISLSLPLMQFDFIYRTLIVGVSLLIFAALVYRLNGYKPEQIGLVQGKHLSAQLVTGLAGLGVGFLEYLILRPRSLTESFGLGSIWLLVLVLVLIVAGFLEELVFRGLMQRASLKKLKIFGPLYVSLVFAVLHIGYKSWIDLVFAFLVGFAFSAIVEYTRSLVGVTLAHGLANISLFLIFPILVGAQVRLPGILSPAPVYGLVIWSQPLQQPPRLAPAAGDTPAPPPPTATRLSGAIVTGIPTSSPSPTSTLTPTATPGYTVTPPGSLPLLPTPTETRLPSDNSTPTATLILPTPTETPIPTDILPEEPTPVPTDVLPIEPNATP